MKKTNSQKIRKQTLRPTFQLHLLQKEQLILEAGFSHKTKCKNLSRSWTLKHCKNCKCCILSLMSNEHLIRDVKHWSISQLLPWSCHTLISSMGRGFPRSNREDGLVGHRSSAKEEILCSMTDGNPHKIVSLSAHQWQTNCCPIVNYPLFLL